MRRFFIHPSCITGLTVQLQGSEAHHLRSVIRAQQGDEVELFDASGSVYHCKISQLDSTSVALQILQTKHSNIPSGPALHLAIGLCKGKTMDLIIQKATELGVHTVTLLSTRYSDASTGKERSLKQLARWQRIMLAACKQCKRTHPMAISGPLDLNELQLDVHDLSLLLNITETTQSFADHNINCTIHSLCLLIGPEGGWHPDEVSLLERKGAAGISLGQLTLRAETAVISTLSICQFLLGNLQHPPVRS